MRPQVPSELYFLVLFAPEIGRCIDSAYPRCAKSMHRTVPGPGNVSYASPAPSGASLCLPSPPSATSTLSHLSLPPGAGHAYPRQYVLMNLRFVRKWVVQVAWARDCARLITPISTLGSSGIQLAAYSSGFVQLAFGTHNLYTRRLRTVLRGQNRCSAYFCAAYQGAYSSYTT